MRNQSNNKNEKEKSKNELATREKAKISSLIRKRCNSLMIEASVFKNTKINNFCGKLMSSINLLHLMDVGNLIFQCLLSFMAVTVYIVDTYYPDIDTFGITEDQKTSKLTLAWLEFSIAIIICVSYVISFILDNKKTKVYI